MPRPQKCRRVGSIPGTTFFKPAGIPMRLLEEVQLTLEEAEALRLKEIEELDQESASTRMNVSRPTFQRDLASAHRKVADALLNGKAIRIVGGNFVLAGERYTDNKLSEGTIKIAIATDDGSTVCQHFGRATSYNVLIVENGEITDRQTRDKPGHQTFSTQDQPGVAGGVSGTGHGYGTRAQFRHASMAQPVLDCQVIIAGGMGWGAYNNLKSQNMEVVITDIRNINEAVKLYLTGQLPNLTDRLH